jgi:hypothetical protein
LLGESLKRVLDQLPEQHRVTMTDDARELWASIYSKLSLRAKEAETERNAQKV